MSGAAVVRLAAWRAAGLGGLPWRDTPPAPAWRRLLQEGRALAPFLLSRADDPHLACLDLLWGPRFDRDAAVADWLAVARDGVRPATGMPPLHRLLQAADRFDALDAPLQQRLRRVLLRHRRLHGRSAGDAAGPARAG